MEGYLTEPGAEKDHTDEFPVLSEKAILEMQSAANEPGSAATKSLAGMLESLLVALGKAEKRWGSLESKLEAHSRAIAELEHDRGGQPGTTDTAPGSAEVAPRSVGEPRDSAGPELPTSDTDASSTAARKKLLERIASLENYIAGRSGRWREIEAELRTRAARIGELEEELAERLDRERDLERRLAAAGSKSKDLRSQLQILSMKLGAKPAAPDAPEPGRVLELRPDLRLASPEAEGTIEPALPKDSYRDSPVALLCLSSDHGESYSIGKVPFTIGRSRDNDIRIDAESVSRRHAIIRRDASGTFIEDQSSTNGVYVNGERVECTALQPGDEITIGGHRFRFLVGAPT